MSQQTLVGGGVFTNKNLNDINNNFTELYGTAVGGTLTSAHLLVGNGSNVATDTAITGDVTISNAGVTAIKASVSLTTPVLGEATGTSLNLSGNCRAASYNVGATAGVDAGPFTTITAITVSKGIVTALTGS